jgi:putative flippase GtrA
MTRLLRFGVAGGAGFAVDAVVLALLTGLTPLGPFVSRLISIAIALFATWQINRRLTFAPSARGTLREGARYRRWPLPPSPR